MSAVQTDVFIQLSATFSGETIRKWEDMIFAWNANSKAPNPYQEPICGKHDFSLRSGNVANENDQQRHFKMSDYNWPMRKLRRRHSVTLLGTKLACQLSC
jgi:hypothetical protein